MAHSAPSLDEHAARDAIASSVAILGEDATVAHVSDLSGVDREAVIAAVGHGVDGLTALDGSRLRFADELSRQRVLDGLSASDRASLHLRAARALAAHGAPNAVIADHLEHVDTVGEEWVTVALRAAAREDAGAGDFVGAARRLRRALGERPSQTERR